MAKYQIFTGLTINKKTIQPNFIPVYVPGKGPENTAKPVIDHYTADPKNPVYVELPPKDAISKDPEVLKDPTNPKVSQEEWDKTIKQWENLGFIMKVSTPKIKEK